MATKQTSRAQPLYSALEIDFRLCGLHKGKNMKSDKELLSEYINAKLNGVEVDKEAEERVFETYGFKKYAMMYRLDELNKKIFSIPIFKYIEGRLIEEKYRN